MAERKKLTIPDLYAMVERGEKITFLTAYDYPTARLEDRAGIDMILVGDSGVMCLLGHATTLPAKMDFMVEITAAVSRAVERAFVVGDMPYMSYQPSNELAIENAGRLIAEGGADAVKLEGGARMAERVEAIVRAGIPVMGHIGLTPQAASLIGGLKAQGRTAETAKQLIEDAKVLEEAGAFAILLEAIPARVAEIIVRNAKVPILSIGSGAACHGQLLIVHDILNLFEAFTPKFVKKYADVASVMLQAFQEYIADVKAGRFPTPDHEYRIPKDEWQRLLELLGEGERR
ncbi:3-methyl-2-oxobutanoate hydroxymethyltransferase [Candidatus Bipolaricaulota bacterium]|nr:3-methyl-2-oxobutanoate hydroxymethyltransferase [Candidatus Bipolaricaulota bacterium]RLE32181.1 MAG: 3-methyl-2-oxobutanoate hydroxymethyltransferase [Candidatus Acetothermia bacterium]